MTANAARATPARFDGSSQHRRSMIAKIQIARQQLGLHEDDYRQILFDETGRASLKDCSELQLSRVIDRLKSRGFRPMPATGKGGGKGTAAHPMARKARALWISLYQLGAVHNASEHALEAFAKRQIGCDRLVWARQSDAFRLIEALKAMAKRAGWMMFDPCTGKPLSPLQLQTQLCQLILTRLKEAGAVPADWALHDAAWKLCGIENAKDSAWTAEDYGRLASALGDKLREAGGRAGS